MKNSRKTRIKDKNTLFLLKELGEKTRGHYPKIAKYANVTRQTVYRVLVWNIYINKSVIDAAQKVLIETKREEKELQARIMSILTGDNK